MSELANGQQGILPASHPGYAKLHCPAPGPTREEREVEARLIRDAEVRGAGLAEVETCQRAELIRLVEDFVGRYVILPSGSLLPVTLWIICTHVFDLFPIFPYLAITSAVKRCGKTRLLQVLEALCRAPVRFTFPSAAVLYRVIQERKPTLLLDEVENLNNPRNELSRDIRAILNAGFEAGGKVPRCGGKRGDKLEFFNVYSPKALACIGHLPDTIADRSIMVQLQRRKPGEAVERFIGRKVEPEGKNIHAAIAQTLTDLKATIKTTFEGYPDLDYLSDRDADCWLPLFAVCHVVAPDYLSDLRDCAELLCGQKDERDVDDSFSIRLLTDIQELWPKDAPQIFTRQLLELLKAKEESPWAEEVPLNARKLSRMLKPFGIERTTVRVGETTGKGYRLDDFESAFSRYLTSKR